MAKVMYDSVTAADIPDGAQLVGGYVDGDFAWSDEDWARFPSQTHVKIATQPGTVGADVYDVEFGALTIDQAVQSVRTDRENGHYPSVYVDRANWSEARVKFIGAGMSEPPWWVADWTGSNHLVDGSAATQYANPDTSGGHFDISQTIDNWPSRPVIEPPNEPQPTGDAEVQASAAIVRLAGGHGWIPSPVPAADVVSVILADENPEAVGRYDGLPTLDGVADQASADAPNGAIVVHGPDGTFGVTIWHI